MRIAVVDMETLASNWGAVLFRGLVTVGFGIVTLLAPGISLAHYAAAASKHRGGCWSCKVSPALRQVSLHCFGLE